MEPFLINPMGLTDFSPNPRRSGSKGGKKLRAVMRKAASLRKAGMSASQALSEAWKRNPQGEIIMYSNPKRKRRSRKASRRRNPISTLANPRRKRRSRRNPVASFSNPRRRSRRGYRRNPAMMGLSLGNVIPLLKDAAYVAGGAVLVDIASGYAFRVLPNLNSNNAMRAGTKAVLAVTGGVLLGKFVGRKQGALLAVGGLVPIITDYIQQAVKGVPMLSQMATPAPAVQASFGGSLESFAPLDGLGSFAPLMV